jgi:hypothetical protein
MIILIGIFYICNTVIEKRAAQRIADVSRIFSEPAAGYSINL